MSSQIFVIVVVVDGVEISLMRDVLVITAELVCC